MVERARRLRMGLAHPSPGASGDTARPNYVGPSGQPGWFGRMNAGESPRNQGRFVCRPPLSVWRRRSRGLRKHAAVERREVNALRTGVRRKAYRCDPRLVALRSPHIFGEGAFPLVRRGDGNPGAPRAVREQGRRSFGFLLRSMLGCLKRESESAVRARPRHSIPPRLRVGWPSGGA